MPTLGELAIHLELELHGDPNIPIQGLAAIGVAKPEHLSVVAEKKHLHRLAKTQAGAVILHPDWLDTWPGSALLSPTPYLAYAYATRIFDNHPLPSGQVHTAATVAASARLGDAVTIDAGACIEAVDGHRMLGLAWLERFYDACTAEGAAGFDCRIDQQAVHAYSCGGVTWMIELMKGKAGLKTPDAAHCSNGVQDADEFGTDCGGNVCTACSAHARAQFAKPVWLTEFGTPSDDCGTDDEAALIDKTAAFMRQELPALDADPYVYRYAWFMPKTDISTLTHGDLLIEDRAGERTALGELYLAPPESP
mgnify:CR=1 FL=1